MLHDRSIIRVTESVCPVCFKSIEARVIQRDGGIFLDKACAAHGTFSLLLSYHPDYYKGLSDFYFSLFDKSLLQRDYIVQLTDRCGLSCPICLAAANTGVTAKYPLENLQDFLKGKKGYKFDLMGAEPTMREDLPAIIRAVKNSGNIPVIHTNGIRIAEYEYLKELKKSGLCGVCLQFDGFDDSVYEKLRGCRLLDIKRQVLDNLEKANIATNLIVTVARGINDKEMSGVLQFSLTHTFIKGVFFLGYRFMGKARNLPSEACLMPDELIDMLEEQTRGKISRQAVFYFQKLYFALLAAFSIRKCFYIHHFLIARAKNGYVTADRLLDLKRIHRKLKKFKALRMANSKLALPYLVVSLAVALLNPRIFFWFREFLFYGLWGCNLVNLPRKSILIGFISSCDTYSFDSEIARHCGKGTISLGSGVQDSGACYNIMADKRIAAKQST